MLQDGGGGGGGGGEEEEEKVDKREIEELMYNFDHVHLEELTKKDDPPDVTEVYYREDRHFFIYTVTTRKMPAWLTTDDFKI